MTLVVAEITRDHLYEKWQNEGHIKEDDINHKGKEFHYDAMQDWWGWEDECVAKDDIPEEKTKFKLFDDDDELYYSGWLLNDAECIVQSFVQKWAEADSGCTTILIYKDSEAGFVQEIG